MGTTTLIGRALALAAAMTGLPVDAQQADKEPPTIVVAAKLTADVTGVAAGGVARGARYLDNLDVVADADLERMTGWRRSAAHVSLLNNFGGRPNDLAGSIQGIDNVEVAKTRLKLYEAWVEKGVGAYVTLRTGLYDVNSEFYQNDAAGLLISPMFGVGSELASTGVNGPAIFPSTALAMRFRAATPSVYAAVAIVNARAGTIGDEHGIDVSGRDGALLIGEVGWTGRGKLAIGAWHYTREQPRIIPPGVTLADRRRYSEGVYLLAERGLIGVDDGGRGRYLAAFLRIGGSDGVTTPFGGGWQSGMMLKRPFAARPNGVLSLGIGSGLLSGNYRRSTPVDLPRAGPAETIVEATYRDDITANVAIQPDIQYVIHPAANPLIRSALILGVRLTIRASNGR
ncbi:MAG: carbohydrate porin [Sphingomonas phyllosphaerae]